MTGARERLGFLVGVIVALLCVALIGAWAVARPPTDAPSEPMLTRVPSAMKASNEGGFVGFSTSGSTIQVPTSGCPAVAVSCMAPLAPLPAPATPTRMTATSAIKANLRRNTIHFVGLLSPRRTPVFSTSPTPSRT